MTFDLPTLMAAGSFVAAFAGVFILYAWTQNREARGLYWWGIASLCQAVGVGGLLAGQTTGNVLLILPSSTALALGPGIFWAAARLLNNRKPIPALIPVGAAVQILVVPLPFMQAQPHLAMALNLVITAVYFFAAAIELWGGRGERIGARWPLVALVAIHALIFLMGAIESGTGSIPFDHLTPLGTWFGLIYFESIVFSLGTAVFVVAFARERLELGHKAAADTDALTKVAARRAFVIYAEKLLKQCLLTDEPLSIVVFDLDRFKAINDTYGHAVGDKVLEVFGEAARSALRKDDRVGRLGGEEFGVVLPGASLGAAFVVANRIREAFSAACASLDGQPIAATVSGGVAIAHPNSTLHSMLNAADEGLYRAKALGRNRVERPPTAREAPFLNRVA